jgi:hypothetical protein
MSAIGLLILLVDGENGRLPLGCFLDQRISLAAPMP